MFCSILVFHVRDMLSSRFISDIYRSFSLSRNKKINWKPSSGRSRENDMLQKTNI